MDLIRPPVGVDEATFQPPTIRSNIATLEQLDSFNVELELRRCGKCNNNCLMTINTFTAGSGDTRKASRFLTGNRCERGAELGDELKIVDASNKANTATGSDHGERKLPNLFDWKYKRLFAHYKPLRPEEAPRGDVGLPRVLNLYENYPLWFTIFTQLGFRVRLSPRSSRSVYEMGLETIPSESVCYPGKIAHGHVEALLKQGVKFIFYPCAPYEIKEDDGAGNHYNCPIVTSYPEVLRNNVDALRRDPTVTFMNPFLPIYHKDRLAVRLHEELREKFDIPMEEIVRAVDAAWKEQESFRRETQQAGEEALTQMIIMGGRGIVLSGRPYHLDPEINHGIDTLITRFGAAVVTEDAISHRVEKFPTTVLNQWTYHARLYASFQIDEPYRHLLPS